jgi:hypothetical protein
VYRHEAAPTTERTIFSVFKLIIIIMTHCHQYSPQFIVFLAFFMFSDHCDREIDELFDDAVNVQECSSSLRNNGEMTLAAFTRTSKHSEKKALWAAFRPAQFYLVERKLKPGPQQ